MAYPKLRKVKMALSDDEALRVLREAEYGIISTVSPEGYCYGVPVNHVVVDNVIYFHGLKGGHKADNIAYNPNVCFTAVGPVTVLPDKFDTNYESVVVFGKAEIVEDSDERKKAIYAICERFSMDYMADVPAVLERDDKRMMIIKITVGHFTGKHNKR